MESGGILKSGIWLAVGSVLTLMLSFLSSMLLVRHVGGETYGMYVYLLAKVAVIPVFYNSFDQVLLRFGSLEDNEKKVIYLRSILANKTIIFSLVSGLLLGYEFFGSGKRGDSVYLLLFILLLIKELLEAYSSSFRSLLAVLERYLLLQGLSILETAFYLFSILFLVYALRITDAKFLVYLVLVMIGFRLVFLLTIRGLVSSFFRVRGRLLLPNFKWIGEVYSREKLSYFGPLQLVSLQTYFKRYLPALLLGKWVSLYSVSVYEVLRKIYDLTYKFVPKIMNVLFPSVIKAKVTNVTVFNENFERYATFYLSLMAVIGLGLYLFRDSVIGLFGLNYPDLKLISFLFSLELVIVSIGQINNYLIRCSTNTGGIWLSSFVRNIIGVFILCFLTYKVKMAGAVWARVFNSVMVSLLLIYFSHNWGLNFKLVKILMGYLLLFSMIFLAWK